MTATQLYLHLTVVCHASGAPTTVTTQETVKNVPDLALQDRRVTIRQLVEADAHKKTDIWNLLLTGYRHNKENFVARFMTMNEETQSNRGLLPPRKF
ncbi:hypothetical protein Trydic_g18841 [Trypoxylus dichotomus]